MRPSICIKHQNKVIERLTHDNFARVPMMGEHISLSDRLYQVINITHTINEMIINVRSIY